MTYHEQQGSASAVKEMLSASTSLRDLVSKVKEADPDLPKIDVRMTETTFGGSGGQPRSSSRLIITIEAESQAHAEEHAADLVDQGCYCSSTGETSVECDCSHL